MEYINERAAKSNFALSISLAANFCLAVIKSVIGVAANSSALLADGINSTSDVIYLVFVKIYMKFADKPADKEHPYGHGQLESIASIIVGAFVLTTAVAIFWDSVNRVYLYFLADKIQNETGIAALAVALFTIAAKIYLSEKKKKIGEKYNSTTVAAVSKDHVNDIMSATAALIGITFSILGHRWVDPVAGAFVAVFILKTGIQIIRDSSDELMKTTPESNEYKRVESEVKKVDGVKGIEELYIHRFGLYEMVNLCILVDGEITVKEGDKIADRVEEMLKKENEFIKKVNVHVHPNKIRG